MDDTKNKLNRIWESVRGQSAAHNKLLKKCSITATIILPGLIAFLTSVKNVWFMNSENSFYMLLGFFIFVQIIIGTFVIYSTKSNYDILLDSNDIYNTLQNTEDFLEEVEEDLVLQTFLAKYAQHWIEQIPFFVDNIKYDPKSLKDSLDDIFSVVTDDEDSIILLHPKEHIKFVLYLYDNREDVLQPVWKQETTSGIKIEPKQSRVWKPCEGHVGLAYSKGVTICTMDATHPSILDMFTAPEDKFLESDVDNYKSFSSVTLHCNSNGKMGVLAATSNHKGRFKPNTYALFVNLAAAVVTSILHNQQINDIIDSHIRE